MRAVPASLLALAMLVAPTSRAAAQDAVDVELEPEPDSDLVGPVVLIGVGVIVASTGAGVFAAGNADRRAVEEASDGTAWSSVASAADRAPTLLTVGQLTMGGGIAMILGGVAWLLLRVLDVEETVPISAQLGGVELRL